MERVMFKGFVVYIRIASIIISFLFFVSYIYAGGLKDEAESYREKGYEAQQLGEIDRAISYYQKAVELDLAYAAPHNDLGILFETKGWLDRAEAEYRKALTLDSDYKNAYTNLALLYERKGELEKAAFYWMKRYRLGTPGDSWTREAEKRLEKVGLIEKTKPVIDEGAARTFVSEREEEKTQGEWTRVGSKKPTEKEKKPAAEKRKRHAKKVAKVPIRGDRAFERELQASLKLAEERLRDERGEKGTTTRPEERVKKRVKVKRAEPVKRVSSKGTSDSDSKSYYRKALDYYQKGEYAKALDTIRIAKGDYPKDASLLDLEKTIKNKMKEERIDDHYNEGIIRYQQNDFPSARKEFEAILNILPEE